MQMIRDMMRTNLAQTYVANRLYPFVDVAALRYQGVRLLPAGLEPFQVGPSIVAEQRGKPDGP